MKKILYYFLVALSLCNSAWAQQPDAEGNLVKWMTLQEAMEKSATVSKPIIIDFYTDWCGWCKHMMKTTYANPGLAEYINNYFYPVKFNAEGKDTVEFLGVKYGPGSDQPRAPHQFTLKMMGNKLSYPTTIFLNDFDKTKNEFKLNMLAPGYLDQQKIEPILVFTLENVYRNCSYNDFAVRYNEAFYDTTVNLRIQKLNFQSPKLAFSTPLPKKKKTIVVVGTEWCNACKVMKLTSFIDSSLVDYLTGKFELVDFNPEITDTITYKDHQLINPRTQQMPFHQLALALCRNNVVLPTLVVLDEYMDIIDAIPFYVSPGFLDDIIHYYGEGINKNKSWQEYMNDRKKAN